MEAIDTIAAKEVLPLEIVVHGPIPGMILEHCLLSMYLTRQTPQDPCRSPCLHAPYALIDIIGQQRPIVPDQYCRNHIFLAHDLACLPYLYRFCKPGIKSLRIEAQYYPVGLVGLVTQIYRKVLDQGIKALTESELTALVEASPRGFTAGAHLEHIGNYFLAEARDPGLALRLEERTLIC